MSGIKKRAECCQHSKYIKAGIDGDLMLCCICVDCGLRWVTMLCPNGREFDR